MRITANVSLLAILALGWTAACAAQDRTVEALPGDPHGQVDAIFAPWSAADMPGCAVGISRNGALDYARGYGMANLEHLAPITQDSVFNVASVAKQFTAFSILLLAQEDKLSLDDDVRKFLPEMPDYGKPLTIGHLMHHTSGLRDQAHLALVSGWITDARTQDEMLRIITRQRSVNFAPGSEVSYNNSGYNLLAEIVQRVSGQPLSAFARQRIFAPLGMADTQFQENRSKVVRGRADAYGRVEAGPGEAGGWRKILGSSVHYGPGNLLTTVGDLLKWQQNLLDARVGGKDVQRQMLTSGRLDDGVEIGYGGGLRLQSYRGLETIGHDGLADGYRADTVLFPDQNLAISVLCNNGAAAPDELSREVAEIYLGESMRNDIKPAASASQSAMRALAGTYWSPVTDEVIRLEFKDGALRQLGGPAALVPIGGLTFRDGESTREWSFRRKGADTELSVVDFWPTTRVFERVDEPMPTRQTLAALAGRYRSDETETDYVARLDGEKLVLQWPKQPGMALEPIGGDRFLSPQGWTVSVVRSADGAAAGLTFTSRRLRRLRAERMD